MNLKNKTVVLGVTGSIAAYKIASLASMLKKLKADVHVILTKNACHFITPLTFETLTGNRCILDTFERPVHYDVEHISLAKKADVLLIAPATANIIAKLANGIADDMLSTTALACKCKKIVAPAMNTNMYENPIVQANLKKLSEFGFEIIPPACGLLACGDEGAGKMPEPSHLLSFIQKEIALPKDMQGLRVLITAGATQEAIDPVRFITNHSTGKMGIALATECLLRGADVTLIHANLQVPVPFGVKAVFAPNAQEMFKAVQEHFTNQDIILKTAAVSDYRPCTTASHKIKKDQAEITLSLTKTQDILAWLGQHRTPGQYLCGFAMETENLLSYAREKYHKKQVDLIVANQINESGAGFGTDTNIVTFIQKDQEISLPCLSKQEVAHEIINTILTDRSR